MWSERPSIKSRLHYLSAFGGHPRLQGHDSATRKCGSSGFRGVTFHPLDQLNIL
jgi:hypothetical protein